MDVDDDEVSTDEEKDEEEKHDNDEEDEEDEDQSMEVDGEEPQSPKPKKMKKRVKLKPRKSQINVVQMDAEAAVAAFEGQKAAQLRLKKKFFVEALNFIRQLESASPTVMNLLGSMNKSEALEAISFFEFAHQYQLIGAEV